MPDARYRINTPTVASKVIGGEAVLIHFTSGHYYSTDQTGAAIVERLDGRTVAEVAGAIGTAYTGDGEAIAEAVAAFVRRLEAEGLVVETADTAAAPLPAVEVGGAFVAPELHKYADLQDLLVLDPIHDTDEAGWPVTPADGNG